MISLEKIGLAIGLAVGAAGAAMSVYMARRTSLLAAKIDMTVEELAVKTPVSIKEAMIEKAVRNAVDREVGSTIAIASNQAVAAVTGDMKEQVRRAVAAQYSAVEPAVAKEIAAQVERLDIETLKRDVSERAKTAILKKFDGNLDDVLREFKRNLDSVPKVYGAVLGSMAQKQDNSLVIRLN